MMRKRFGQSVLAEVLEAAVQDAVRATLEERSLRPALQPQITVESEIGEGVDVSFLVALETLPEVPDPDFAAITVSRETVSVDDAALDEAIEDLRKRMKAFAPAPEGAEAVSGDTVVIDFVGRLEGEAFEGGSGEAFRLELGSGMFVPGFEEQLIGAKAGEARTVTVTFPAEYPAETLAGREVVFDVTVNAIENSALPEVDDALAAKVGLETVDQLRDEIRKSIQGEYDEVCSNRVKRRLLDALADMSTFPVPEGLLTQEFEAIWKQVEEAREHGHLDEEDKDKSEEQLRADYKAIAERRLRLGLLLSEIGVRHKITVAPEDLNKALAREMRRFPGQEAMVLNYYRTNKEAIERLRAPVFEDKVCAFILEMASVTETPMTIEALKEAMASDTDA
ncbi:trigger factor [Pararhodospirillum oryzae]|uniref:Trigger factor n=2 Tax=Pararhodospirillum oryzae TaxID=478448 RepID=A0A512HA12_9PROT|nr:trigger factor [Pararhodospirillum oryzae]